MGRDAVRTARHTDHGSRHAAGFFLPIPESAAIKNIAGPNMRIAIGENLVERGHQLIMDSFVTSHGKPCRPDCSSRP